MRRRVTYSRNVTLSLSRTCVSHCKYCAFATHQPHLHEPAAVEQLLDRAMRRRVKELLVLTGDDPGYHPGVREKLAGLGFATFVDYVVWCCERALERGLLPHTNLGALGREDLAKLREVTASQGLMLESTRPDLVAHQGSPTKEPRLRLATIDAAGELRIPFTSGILVGIGEEPSDRLDALAALAASHERYGHIQEVILQNFVPHRRYHGEEPAEIADEASEAYWRTGLGTHPSLPLPRWATAVTIDDMVELVTAARALMPDVGIQVPPNLADWWPQLVAAGATDLGGLSANGDHISPEHPFPSPHQVRKRLQQDGAALTERLCVYPQYIDGDWLDQGVMDVVKLKYWSFIPRRGSGRRQDRPIHAELVSGAIEKGRDGVALSEDELTALFAETRPEAVEEIRAAADELRAELAGDLVTFVVNRNINISNVCIVGCAFCGFGQGKRSPDAYEHDEPDFVRRIHDALEYGATELCIQSGIHPDWDFDEYLRWLRVAKRTAPDIHLHAYSPMEIAHMQDISGLPLSEVFARLRDAGLGSTPGTAAEVLHDGVRERISPNKLPVARWVEIIEASHAAGLRSTSTVMFGHIEEPWELAEHMRVIRELQERTGGITEFVPLSFIPFQTLLGRTHGVEEISREENLKHTAVFRLALGRSIRNVQASWVKMGLETATEALRWGVNDLGGTLMEESISRLAGSQHGTKLDPEQLISAAHAAGRPAAERSTLYEIRREHRLVVDACV
ncbi:5-amino-6-(D-ribitylamino)uracil--L-tyrosine 4-hydroxyphenyl transferase CofH [Conexibacter woesei]|uniref:FO synthase n=1 Tax=Conexibacter woesei (strain DSM 14684 / CCUG 47730 / CIP 108061 / JCM 11494 / NBRC 100937 / ID131577) TaxID=469383 RepID=D3F4P8_CONWI|nr:5-amino-6-(D-ribitylamino)uracil--L-tyrosine 4-hydroxyphenyl transferase CofH [Conexibacter woesei]ADB52505.1 7,8-didemethyl-8-hydroxy-5-deazariboflavin synthase, CofH subunit [Conexibacter woesei DSM 14684]